MAFFTGSLTLNTGGQTDILDITSEVKRLIQESGFSTGLVTIFCPSSTSGVTTIEFESGAVSDLKRSWEELIPSDREYSHNAAWGDGNGHSHIRASLLGPSLSIPIVEGSLSLGTWQQIVCVDFDIRPRQRDLVVQVMGE